MSFNTLDQRAEEAWTTALPAQGEASMRRRTFLMLQLVPLVCLAFAPMQRPAAPKAETPEGVADKGFEAMKAGRYDDFAKTMHRSALKTFKAGMIELAEMAEADGNPDEFLTLFDGVKDVPALKALDDAKVFAAFLRGVEKRDPTLKKTIAGADREVLGHINEGDDLAHVVYRLKLKVDGKDVSSMQVDTLRRDGRGWGLELRSELQAMTADMRRAFEARKQGKDPLDAVGDLAKGAGEPKITVLGSVAEGQGVAHVVYRGSRTIGKTTASKLNVLTLKSGEPGWDLLQKGDKAGLAKFLKENPPLNP